jgi:hypothetical protein
VLSCEFCCDYERKITITLSHAYRFLSLPLRPNQRWGPLRPAILLVGTGSSTSRVNWLGRDTNYSPPSRADGKLM